MNNFLSAARVWGAAVFCVLMAGICAAQTNITEFNIPNQLTAKPMGITFGQDGAYWFVENGSGKIGRIDTVSNVFGEIYITNKSWCQPFGITAGPDNHLWFTEANNNIVGRLDPFTTNYIEYTLPFPTNAQPTSIIMGPDSNLWFVEYALGAIASISPTPTTNSAGKVSLLHEFIVHTNYLLIDLTVGPDTNIWFTEGYNGKVGRLSLNPTNYGNIQLFQLPTTNCAPSGIVAGLDGALWFTELKSNQVGRITVDGVITEYPLPFPGDREPYGMVAGQDGRMWFSLFNAGSIGNITTNGTVTLYPTPTPGSNPVFLASGNPAFTNVTNDANIWFSEDYGFGAANQKIARMEAGLGLSLNAPTTASYRSGTTVSDLTATFNNANGTNLVTVFWGDGTSNYLQMTNTAPFASTNLNPAFVISNTVPINMNNFVSGGGAGTFLITASHVYPNAVSNYVITLVVKDAGNSVSVAKISLPPTPFFAGELAMADQVDFLQFPNGTLYGYYTMAFYPWLYHFDMGFQYVFPANDGSDGVYLFDETSGHFFYTSPALFPYFYDFSLNAWIYYFPDPNRPGHYSANPRIFYNYGTGQFFTQ